MPAGLKMRPRRVDVQGEETVRQELKKRTAKRGLLKGVAADAGIPISSVYSMRSGTRPMVPSVAEQLGYSLAWVRDEALAQVRMEELDLADKIEAEIHSPGRFGPRSEE